MNQVPNIISTKDLMYIEDMFNWNFNACKKINHFRNEVNDPQINALLEEVIMMHKKHVQTILNLIQGGNYEQ